MSRPSLLMEGGISHEVELSVIIRISLIRRGGGGQIESLPSYSLDFSHLNNCIKFVFTSKFA